MRLWLVCFVLLFGIAQFYQWLTHLTWFAQVDLEHFDLPVPVFIMAGVLLAIASNYDKESSFPFSLPTNPASDSGSSADALNASTATPVSVTSKPRTAAEPEPHLSFTIDKTNHRSERRPTQG